MRGIFRRSRSVVSDRRPASAGCVAASILALLLSQPFHAPRPLSSVDAAAVLVAAPADADGAPSDGAAHDADRCPQCRAFGKTRLGLRTPGASVLAANQPALSLHGPSLPAAAAAAERDPARPRAPPAA